MLQCRILMKIIFPIILFTLLLSGCAGKYALSKSDALQENAGIMAVEISSDFFREYGKWRTLSIWSFDENKIYYAELVHAEYGVAGNTALYFAQLPAGRYRLEHVDQRASRSSSGSSSIEYSGEHNLNRIPGGFEIQEGHITDLGAVVLYKSRKYRNMSEVKIEKSRFDDMAILREKYPLIAKQVADNKRYGWIKR